MKLAFTFPNGVVAHVDLTARQDSIVEHAAQIDGSGPYEAEVALILPTEQPTIITEPTAQYREAAKRARSVEASDIDEGPLTQDNS